MHTQPSPANTEPIYLSRTSEAPAEGSPGHRRPARVDTVDTPEEFATIGHLRGWCHDTSVCKICTEQDRLVAMLRDTQEQLVRSQAHARTEELRAVDAQVDVAYLTRALAAMEARALRAETTLNSIIEG
jgi:hypothetical protein